MMPLGDGIHFLCQLSGRSDSLVLAEPNSYSFN
jgi:hypothetical protein